MTFPHRLLPILFLLSCILAYGNTPVSDIFISSDIIGGSKVYTSDSPLLKSGHYYRGSFNEYSGRHFNTWALYGRNSDNEDWKPVFNFLGHKVESFRVSADYRQIKVAWSKSEKEPNVSLGYKITEDVFDHSSLYVSSSKGSDSNDGSINHPFSSIKKAVSMMPGTIRLCCNDIFYESVKSDGIDFGNYGSGHKPVISGLKILPKKAWQLHETTPSGMKIWKVNLSLDKDAYKGWKFGGNNFLNNIGGFVKVSSSFYDSRICPSKRVPSYDDLRKKDAEDFDFFQPIANPSKNTPPSNFNYVYVCYNGSPSDDFGVSSGSIGMYIGNCSVDSIAICYWGWHGIEGKNNVSINDCDIDGIGGMVHLGASIFSCLGNGIEFYAHHPGVENCHVTRCHISHCFDAGLTVQGTEHDATNMQPLEVHNVSFTDNTIENCCQSFEEFLRGNNPTDLYYDCIFANNTSISPGIDTGFRYSDGRYKRSHILTCEDNKSTGMVYRDNICLNGNYLCVLSYHGKYAQGTWIGNKCSIRRGQDLLGNYKGTADVITVPTDKGSYSSLQEATDAAIAKYRELTGDKTTTFTIID